MKEASLSISHLEKIIICIKKQTTLILQIVLVTILFSCLSILQLIMQQTGQKKYFGGEMAYRNGNYTAFYVAEPFNPSALGAYATRDFCYYNMLRTWKAKDLPFPFNDSHEKTYNVRDGSDWETTLKPRLRERLRNSKNILLILSSNTKNSKALREEIDYGVSTQGLPVIVIYPEYNTKESLVTTRGTLKESAKNLWNNLPIFRDSINKVPTLHVPWGKSLIEQSLRNEDFMLLTKTKPNIFLYK